MERPKPIVRGHPTCPYCKDEVRPEQYRAPGEIGRHELSNEHWQLRAAVS